MLLSFIYECPKTQITNVLTINYDTKEYAASYYGILYEKLAKEGKIILSESSYNEAKSLWKTIIKNNFKEVLFGQNYENLKKFLNGESGYKTYQK